MTDRADVPIQVKRGRPSHVIDWDWRTTEARVTPQFTMGERLLMLLGWKPVMYVRVSVTWCEEIKDIGHSGTESRYHLANPAWYGKIRQVFKRRPALSTGMMDVNHGS